MQPNSVEIATQLYAFIMIYMGKMEEYGEVE